MVSFPAGGSGALFGRFFDEQGAQQFASISRKDL